MKYLSIDTETTGLQTGRHQVLEIGAVLEDTYNILDYGSIPKRNIILQYDEYIGSAYALGLNSRIFHILGEYEKIKGDVQKVLALEKEVGSKIIPYNQAYIHLYEFLEKHLPKLGDGRIQITAAGKNVAGFDLPKLNLLPNFDTYFKFNSRCIDPGNYCVLPEDDNMPSSDLCMIRAGLSGTISHKALDDAWDMVQILREKAKGFLYPSSSTDS